MEVERDGKKREILHDHNDMYILHLSEFVVHTHTHTPVHVSEKEGISKQGHTNKATQHTQGSHFSKEK